MSCSVYCTALHCKTVDQCNVYKLIRPSLYYQDYNMTMPYAHCKGILMGTMTMELGGKVSINCEKTGYSTEMEFKLRPFLGGGELTNAVSGRIKIGKETIAVIEGHWDETVTITDKKTGHKEVLWQVRVSIIVLIATLQSSQSGLV